MNELLSAIESSDTLMREGSVTEFLPRYAELTYRFNAGLTARIAGHGNGMYQMTLDGFYHIEPGTADQVIAYLENI